MWKPFPEEMNLLSVQKVDQHDIKPSRLEMGGQVQMRVRQANVLYLTVFLIKLIGRRQDPKMYVFIVIVMMSNV